MSVKEVRNGIGGDILVAMAANDEFPIGNVYRLSKTMHEYFVSEGFEDTLVDLGSVWRPDSDYWRRHLSDVREYLRQENRLFLEYKRAAQDGTFIGTWEFVRKGDFKKIMAKEITGLLTRTDTYNERVGDSKETWAKSEIPSVRLTRIESN